MAEKPRIPLRFSKKMLERIGQACEREGIDKSSLSLVYMYQLIRQIEGGETPEIDVSYMKFDQNKSDTTTTGIRAAEKLKSDFEKAIKILNEKQKLKLNTSDVLRSYLIKFTLESEARNKITIE